jgi:hypothetical protein
MPPPPLLGQPVWGSPTVLPEAHRGISDVLPEHCAADSATTCLASAWSLTPSTISTTHNWVRLNKSTQTATGIVNM